MQVNRGYMISFGVSVYVYMHMCLCVCVTKSSKNGKFVVIDFLFGSDENLCNLV